MIFVTQLSPACGQPAGAGGSAAVWMLQRSCQGQETLCTKSAQLASAEFARVLTIRIMHELGDGVQTSVTSLHAKIDLRPHVS